MTIFKRRVSLFATLCSMGLAAAACTTAVARAGGQTISPPLLRTMRWRNVGPFRGGRTRAVCGVVGRPNVFYIGAVNGGVWKTDDYGRTWNPIFDKESTSSIGAIAVAPSNPNIVYVGSGEGLHRPDLSVGNGIYKSVDGGQTWRHLGLRNGQQISMMAVDPENPDRLFVAVVGHPYGPNAERGIYRSLDGGNSFHRVLGNDENIGGNDVEIDPANPQIVYAALWEAREGPWENGAWNGTRGGIYKSIDGGATWKRLSGGLPFGIIQAYVAIAPSDPDRLLASVAIQGTVHLYRSDDAGAHWTVATTDPRPALRIGGGDVPVPKFDTKNPDVVYSTSIVTWKSVDGGKTWTAFRGAPGGDDYQNIWIDPDNPKIIALVGDQGAIISVNGGDTWSSWYNQPTAQLYHVAADNAFPYRICAGQQESGSVCIASRGNDGEITMRDWHPVGAEEYGYVTPDPKNPNLVYGGRLTRYDGRTTQVQDVAPDPLRTGDYRVVRTQPIVFSPTDPKKLYFAANTLWSSVDGGTTWKQISPDLSRKTFALPATIGIYRGQVPQPAKRRGVIYAIAPSPLQSERIWAGTDDGLIWLTTDGGQHWQNVTPPQMIAWQKVSILDAGHFDAHTAYAAIDTLRLDDLRPHIYRTHDDGKTWTEIVQGIPIDENVNVVREDTKTHGLLFAGTERGTYVSMDDGDHWQALRQNMPATSVRDLLVKDNDLVSATHGRGFWIMDDITPLRQLQTASSATQPALLAPETAMRVRWDTNTDTPIPPDEPAGQNPPDGAIIDYVLPPSYSGPVALEIRDASGAVVRHYSSDEAGPAKNPNGRDIDAQFLDIPAYWIRPALKLSATPGIHRFRWDMHLAPLKDLTPEYPMAAVPHNTPIKPNAPWAMPGHYTVALIADGKTYTQPLVLRMDPRVKTPLAGLEQQFQLSQMLYKDLQKLAPATQQAKGMLARHGVGPSSALQAIVGGRPSHRGGASLSTLSGVQAAALQILEILQGADATPTAQATRAAQQVHRAAQAILAKWSEFQQHAAASPSN
ncbi:MAG: WD40/YVTN/BNR-like repeat-containing protein [Acidobacteriaceae bacterium]